MSMENPDYLPTRPEVPYSISFFQEVVYERGGGTQTLQDGTLLAYYPHDRLSVVAVRAAVKAGQPLPFSRQTIAHSQDDAEFNVS